MLKATIITFAVLCVVLVGIFFITKFDVVLWLESMLGLPESQSFLWSFIFLWIPALTGIAIGIISFVKDMITTTNFINNCTHDIDVCKNQLAVKVPALRDVSTLIPPQYRYSDALSFFVEAYSNSKVDNLKEAVNLFDTHSYRKQMLQYQEKIVRELEDVNFNLSMIADKLDSIDTSIWLS